MTLASIAAVGAAGAPAMAADNQDRSEWLALWRTVVEAEARHDAEATAENEWQLFEAIDIARDAIVDKPATSMVGIAVKLACAASLT